MGPDDPMAVVVVEADKPTISSPKKSVLVNPVQLLEGMLGKGGSINVDEKLHQHYGWAPPSKGAKVTCRLDNPGLTTVCITSYQNKYWGDWLVDHGFHLVCNNVKNRNSDNQLFLYVRIENEWDPDSDLITERGQLV